MPFATMSVRSSPAVQERLLGVLDGVEMTLRYHHQDVPIAISDAGRHDVKAAEIADDPHHFASTRIAALSTVRVRLRSVRPRTAENRSDKDKYRSSAGRENHSEDTRLSRPPRLASTL
jgi:hypothetical protein